MTAFRFRSSEACASASLTIRSISSLARPVAAVIVIFCSLAVAVSFALTWRMPLASMSKVTSILGTPRGAAGIPSRWNLPRVRLGAAISRSPPPPPPPRRHYLVGVHALVRIAAEEALHHLDDLRDPGGAADEHDLVDLVHGDPGVLDRQLAGLERPVEDLLDHLLHPASRELELGV